MDSEELKRACELAGLSYQERYDEWECGVFDYKSYDPALPSYVASLLVAKVLDSSNVRRSRYNRSVHPLFTDEQRIRAAVAALETGDD